MSTTNPDKEAHLSLVSAMVEEALKASRYRFVVALIDDDRVQVAANLPDPKDVPVALRAAADNFERDLERDRVRGFEQN